MLKFLYGGDIMCTRKCAKCGSSLDENFYLCRDCYQDEPLKYMRFLVYNIDEDYSRVYDYVSTDIHYNILEHICGNQDTIINIRKG